MSFRSSGSQESISLNGAWIRVETKKLWLFEDNCTKLSEMSCENFAGCFTAAKPPFGTRVPFRSSTPSFHSCENVSTLQKCSLAVKWPLVAKWPPSYESSCKSSPSCGITSKLWNHLQVAKPKFKLAKWTIQRANHLAKSTCAISDICNRLS